MLSITSEIKKSIQKYDSIEERLEYLKDKYTGETAYITSCGPSIKEINSDELKSKLKNKLVMSIKQSFDIVGSEICDFHLVNTYNLKPEPYDYGNNNTIIAWTLAKSYQDHQLKKIVKQNRPFDLYIPVINPPFITDDETIAGSLNFDDMKLLGERCEVTWGKGTIYESAIPLLYHIGVKDIVTIGWDLKVTKNNEEHKHFYKNNLGSVPQDGELEQLVSSSYAFYDWCEKNKIRFRILSDINEVDKRFERISLKDIND